MTMALKHSQIFSNDGRIKPRIQDDACAAEHLACIGQLLRAKCSLTSDQYTYLKSLLKARDDTLQPPAEQQVREYYLTILAAKKGRCWTTMTTHTPGWNFISYVIKI